MEELQFNPIDIGLLCANAVMLDANLAANLVKKLGLGRQSDHGNLG